MGSSGRPRVRGPEPVGVLPLTVDVGGTEVRTRVLIVLDAIDRAATGRWPVRLSMAEVGLLCGRSASTVRRWADEAEAEGLLEHSTAYLPTGGVVGRLYGLTARGARLLSRARRRGAVPDYGGASLITGRRY